MKNILLLSLLLLTFSCCKDPNPKPEEPPYQEYTSFQVWSNVPITLPNVVVGFQDSTGYWHRVCSIGTLYPTIKSDTTICDTLNSIVFFTDYMSPRRIDSVFELQTNRHNLFEFPENIRGVSVDNNNHYQYPF